MINGRFGPKPNAGQVSCDRLSWSIHRERIRKIGIGKLKMIKLNLRLAGLLAVAFLMSTPLVSLGQTDDPVPTTKYDAALAKKLGADEYGMKSYVFVILKTGKEKITDKEESKKIFAGHFANMSRLAKAGKLVLAGPLVEDAPNRGIYIFNVTTLKEAEDLVKTDPAVKAGVFGYEMKKLYCSAALMKIAEIHKTIQKTKIE